MDLQQSNENVFILTATNEELSQLLHIFSNVSINDDRHERWYVATGAFDQWLATIKNHRHSIESNGCPQKIYHHSI